jgi:hypothetical protein
MGIQAFNASLNSLKTPALKLPLDAPKLNLMSTIAATASCEVPREREHLSLKGILRHAA